MPWVPSIYEYTAVCYSYSKSLSLRASASLGARAAGERVGPSRDVRRRGCGAVLGFVCAPALFQRVVIDCVDVPSDVEAYARNRDVLCGALKRFGYSYVEPDGAFYLWVRSPDPDAEAFCERARAFELLPVPSNSFGAEGWLRVGYCVAAEVIEGSLPAWEQLAREYGLQAE